MTTTIDPTADTTRAALVQVDKALESSRDSGYDLTAAVGEVVDNSIEGKATLVRIRTDWDKHHKRIEKIAFADNGIGVPLDILSHVLSLGFSTRYGSRDGLGRFGVGLKLATLSHARRIDIYTQPAGSDQLLHTYLDLDEVSREEQLFIESNSVQDYPKEFAQLMNGSKGEPLDSGTLVIWSKIDRLEEGGNYGQANKERLQELTRFLGRAYRRFIDGGLTIELNGREIALHDPLFLLPNPRVEKRFGELRSTIFDETTLIIDGHEVQVTVALLPEVFRQLRGKGARADRAGEEFADLYIPDNEGKISILRQGREINYDLVAKMLPGGVKWGDRFIGIEVSFPAALDEYFQVRNVKRGFVPVSKLREELRSFLAKPVNAARREIKRYWTEVATQNRVTKPEHTAAQDAVNRAEQTTPRGRAGSDMSEEQQTLAVDGLLDEVMDEDTPAKERDEVNERLQALPISIVDRSWPGKEMFDITHLNGKAILQINQRHPFIKDVYLPLKELADKDSAEIEAEEVLDLARRVETAIDLLFMAYAKAENMHSDPDEVYGDLRSDWGRYTSAYIRDALRDVDE